MSACRLCDSADLEEIGMTKVLGRHSVRYYRCRRCGYRQTETPTWLAEAYADPINRFDTGFLARTVRFAAVTKAVIACGFDRRGRFLDFGGGPGLFVRMMRDHGLDFRWQDLYCKNQYAIGFEAGAAEKGFELVTCYEVFEHLVQPGIEARALLDRADALLFSTELAPESDEAFWKWPYVGPDHGQHVGFYSRSALQWFARENGFHYATDGHVLHLLTRRPFSSRLFRVLAGGRASRAVSWCVRWPGLTMSDHEGLRKAAAQQTTPVTA